MDQGVLSSILNTANTNCRLFDFFFNLVILFVIICIKIAGGPPRLHCGSHCLNKQKKVSQLISCLILLADAELSLFITVLTVRVVLIAQHFQHNVHEKAETWATHIIIHFLTVSLYRCVLLHSYRCTGTKVFCGLSYPVTVLYHVGIFVTARGDCRTLSQSRVTWLCRQSCLILLLNHPARAKAAFQLQIFVVVVSFGLGVSRIWC